MTGPADPPPPPSEATPRGYDSLTIEKKWQDRWREDPASRRARARSPEEHVDDGSSAETLTSRDRRRRERKERRRRFYCLDMFPYPSVDGLSVNQLRGMAITDVVARYQEARGRQVFRPMGWDCFGLTVENEADKHGLAPAQVVDRGIERMRGQLETFGARVDWEGEIRTTDPQFYRWTQWIFTQMLERGVAYRDAVSMKWCSSCRMNLANEEVSDGQCVHCDGVVDERHTSQWKLGITQYAERLQQGLRHLKWPQRVKSMQRHWIGKVDGYRLRLKITGEFAHEFGELDVFVRQLELLPAATYLVLAPEHPLVDAFCDELYREEVEQYRRKVVRLTERERLAAGGDPEGHPTGAQALNPITLQPIPVWVSKMVLPDVRFGAVLGIPGHNPRHAEFARHFGLAQRVVISRGDAAVEDDRRENTALEPVMINCGPLSGATTQEARRRIRARLDARGAIEPHTDVHLRDWIFARQRFWGEPIPIVHCPTCGPVTVPAEELPVELPRVDVIPKPPAASRSGPTEVVEVEASGSTVRSGQGTANVPIGETWDIFTEELPSAPSRPEAFESRSPLSTFDAFCEASCPRCGGDARRDTDTMPQWAASCWYYLRYLDPNNGDAIFDREQIRDWLPVDLCVGGIQHAILHLLYVRFFSYFLHDLELTAREEPFRRLFNQGRIYARRIDPARTPVHRGDRILAAEYLERYGGDALRLHLLFLGPPESDVVWNESGLRGARRFAENAFRFVLERKAKGRFVSRKVLVEKHRLIRRVTTAIRTFRMNKAVSAFMAFVKTLDRAPLTPEEVDAATLRTFTVLLAPFAPHLASELWEHIGDRGTVFDQPWPEYSEELLRPVEPLLAVQINGRVRDRFRVPGEPSKSELIALALERPRIRELLGEREPDRVVVVPDRLINLVVSAEVVPVHGQQEPESEAPPGAAG
ncbi:MAG: class I tRNA ligase family protein [Planctomycetes bacterium]|nr:class I tRNA ligase family protein [Planctomycetota bacterium]